MLNTGNIVINPCPEPPGPDTRCEDPAFALANPGICPPVPQLIIKPSVALACPLQTVCFKAFITRNGVEEEVTTDLVWESSSPTTAVIAACSGCATGFTQGDVTIAAHHDGKTAYASLSILSGAECCCCDSVKVAMMVLIDNSRSMGLAFNASYSTKLIYAKALATQFVDSVNTAKDTVGLIKFNDLTTDLLSTPSADTVAVTNLITGITQTNQLTSYREALEAAVTALDATTADRKIIVIISDGEDTTETYTEDTDPLAVASQFRSDGGIIFSVGVRSHGRGTALLNAFSTGGFFLNAYNETAEDTISLLVGMRGYLCAGNCSRTTDGWEATGQFNYTDFEFWSVTDGTVDLKGNGFYDFLPGHGMYVDLAGTREPTKGKMTLRQAIDLSASHAYRLTVELAGNQRKELIPMSARVKLYYYRQGDATPVNLINQVVVINDYKQCFTPFSFSATAPDADVEAFISIQMEDLPSPDAAGDQRIGLLLNSVQLYDVTDRQPVFEDDFDNENITFLARCGSTTETSSVYGESDATHYNMNWPSAGGETPRPPGPGGYPIAEYWLAEPDCDTIVHLEISRTVMHPMMLESYDNGYIQYTDQTGGVTNLTLTVLNYASPEGTQVTDVLAMPCVGGTKVKIFLGYVSVTQGWGRIISDAYWQCSGEQQIDSTGYGYGCYGYGCLAEPPPAQREDPNPLSDIERGYNPPRIYTSTRTAYASCDAGYRNIPATPATPAMTSAIAPSGVVSTSFSANITIPAGKDAYHLFDRTSTSFQVQSPTGGDAAVIFDFGADQTIATYGLTIGSSPLLGPAKWELSGSADGLTYTVLDERQEQAWFANERKLFEVYLPAAYRYYKLTCQDLASSAAVTLEIVELDYLVATAQSISHEATATSEVSQANADMLAIEAAVAAAQADLNCVRYFSSTQTYTAHCPLATLGADSTQSATAIGYLSQAETDDDAQRYAQAFAEAALDCTGSNNLSPIVIGDMGTAQPYPSVYYHDPVETREVAKVVVHINGLTHLSFKDIMMVLRSPIGSVCVLLGQVGQMAPESNLDITFDDDAPTEITIFNPMPPAIHKPSPGTIDWQDPANAFFPAPVEPPPYGEQLIGFSGLEDAGRGAWSLWVIDSIPWGSGQIASWSLSFEY